MAATLLREISQDEHERARAMSRKKYEMDMYSDYHSAIEDGKILGQRIGMEQGLEQGQKLGLEQGQKLGLEKGLEQGLEQGQKLGLEQGREEGLEQGQKLGREKGLAEERLIIARNALLEGATVEFIQKITGLSFQEISESL